jgi:hypothetical protein
MSHVKSWRIASLLIWRHQEMDRNEEWPKTDKNREREWRKQALEETMLEMLELFPQGYSDIGLILRMAEKRLREKRQSRKLVEAEYKALRRVRK